MRRDEKIPDEVHEVIDLAVKKQIHTLKKVVEHLNGMVFFATICIKNVVWSREWRLKHKKYKFRHFATVADESLAMLVRKQHHILDQESGRIGKECFNWR